MIFFVAARDDFFCLIRVWEQDLKRLTQKRMQQSGGPATPKSPAVGQGEGFGRPATPKINVAAINASTPVTPGAGTPGGAGPGTPVMPKMGMTVQELKQLTTLRLASQTVPTRQTEITGLVSNAVLNNAAKSQYRDTLRSSLTPGSAPKRTAFSLAPRGNNEVIPVRGNRSRSRSSQLARNVESIDAAPARYSYSGQSLEEFLAFDYSLGDGGNSSSSQVSVGSHLVSFVLFADEYLLRLSRRLTRILTLRLTTTKEENLVLGR